MTVIDAPIPAHAVAALPYTLAEHGEFTKRLAAGEVRADELKATFERARASIDAIKAELGAKTLKELAPNGTRGRKKPEVVRSIASNVLGRFAIGQMVSYSPFAGETYEMALAKAVATVTDEEIEKAVAEANEYRAKLRQTFTDPQTLQQFQDFIRARGEKTMSSEQRARYDTLVAGEALKRREQEQARAATVAKVELGDLQFTLIEGWHDKRQAKLWIVQLPLRVARDVYDDLNRKAKMLGGWFSSFKKQKAGVHFYTEELARRFMALKDAAQDRTDVLEARAERTDEATAERLAEQAERVTERAEAKLESPRLVNTHRRARMAAGVEADARADLAMAATLQKIAEGISAGTLKLLAGVKARTHLEALDRVLWRAMKNRERAERMPHDKCAGRRPDLADIDHVEFPWPHLTHTMLRSACQIAGAISGAKLLARSLLKRIAPGAEWVTFKDGRGLLYLEKLVARLRRGSRDREAVRTAEYVADSMVQYNRLAAMGIENTPMLRAALREYLGVREAQKAPDPILVMERALIGRDMAGFFPTPGDVCEEMVRRAQIADGMLVLEPSAGKGDILDAIKAAFPNPPGVVLEAVEVNYDLRAILEAKGYAMVGRDFLTEPLGPQYERILMNPPFERGADADHVRHAYDLLAPGGRLVAVMSEGTFFRADARAGGFRDWLARVGGESEKLPEDSFNGSDAFRQTGVNTRLVVIDRK